MRNRSKPSTTDTSFATPTASGMTLASRAGLAAGDSYGPRIYKLWVRWMPSLRAERIPSTTISRLCDEHHDWCVRLFDAGVKPYIIKLTRLDTPLVRLEDREMWLKAFLVRRAKRVAQGFGIKKRAITQ